MEELRNELMQLKSCGEKIVTLSETLLASIGAETPSYTLEDVRKACTEKSRMGRTDSVKAILLKYEAEKLSALKPEDYGMVLQEVEAL